MAGAKAGARVAAAAAAAAVAVVRVVAVGDGETQREPACLASCHINRHRPSRIAQEHAVGGWLSGRRPRSSHPPAREHVRARLGHEYALWDGVCLLLSLQQRRQSHRKIPSRSGAAATTGRASSPLRRVSPGSVEGRAVGRYRARV